MQIPVRKNVLELKEENHEKKNSQAASRNTDSSTFAVRFSLFSVIFQVAETRKYQEHYQERYLLGGASQNESQ